MEVTEGEEGKQEAESLFKEIWLKISNCGVGNRHQGLEAITIDMMNQNNSTLRHKIKLSKVKDQENFELKKRDLSCTRKSI